jgi:hypothetical protein
MRPCLLVLFVLASSISLIGCKTGPGTASGPSACDQLRACSCDADAGALRLLCNSLDALEAADAGEDACRFWLTTYQTVCGTPLQVRASAGGSNLEPGVE